VVLPVARARIVDDAREEDRREGKSQDGNEERDPVKPFIGLHVLSDLGEVTLREGWVAEESSVRDREHDAYKARQGGDTAEVHQGVNPTVGDYVI
jgi:hypothetical protein